MTVANTALKASRRSARILHQRRQRRCTVRHILLVRRQGVHDLQSSPIRASFCPGNSRVFGFNYSHVGFGTHIGVVEFQEWLPRIRRSHHRHAFDFISTVDLHRKSVIRSVSVTADREQTWTRVCMLETALPGCGTGSTRARSKKLILPSRVSSPFASPIVFPLLFLYPGERTPRFKEVSKKPNVQTSRKPPTFFVKHSETSENATL